VLGRLSWRRGAALGVLTAGIVAAVYAWNPQAGEVAAAFVVNSVVCSLALGWAFGARQRPKPAREDDLLGFPKWATLNPPGPPAEEDPLLTRLKRSNGRCPDCEGDLVLGSKAGMCVNVRCAGCGARFNIGFSDAPFFIERI
jgi:hypothetical protein